MRHQIADHPSLVSSRLYGLILSTPGLARRLIPQGLTPSPYEVLDYTATLTLHDDRGFQATIDRQETIRFVQDGVSAILDHAWGDGITVTSYQSDAGVVEGMLRDQGKRHLLIGLKRQTRRGEILSFKVERTLAAAFTGVEEWLTTVIDHPVRQLTCNVIFPTSRPCRSCYLDDGQIHRILPVISGSNGNTLVHFHKTLPSPHTPYRLVWCW